MKILIITAMIVLITVIIISVIALITVIIIAISKLVRFMSQYKKNQKEYIDLFDYLDNKEGIL